MSEFFIPPNAKFEAPDPETSEPRYVPRSDPSSSRRTFDDSKDRRLCKSCRAWGRLLITPSGYCRHCLRVLCINFDPSTSPFCRAGNAEGPYVDITPSSDGGVLKRVDYLPPIDESESDRDAIFPQEGCPCTVHYIGRLSDPVSGEIFDTTRDLHDGLHIGGTDDPLTFLLLREKVVEGLDLGVSTMRLGEKASFIVRADYGYGGGGASLPASLPKVQLHSTLCYSVELLSFKDSLPRFPSKEELEATKRERNEEAREEMKRNPPIPYASRVASAYEEKEIGNRLYNEGKWKEAKEAYDSGFVHIYLHRDEWNACLNDSEREMMTKAKAVLHLNRCMCRLKMELYQDAIWDADKSIEFGPGSAKAHYRRGVVYSGFLETELAKEDKGKYWDVDKAKKYCSKAWKDFDESRKLGAAGAPDDVDGGKTVEDALLRKATLELERKEKVLARCSAEYAAKQRELYSDKMMGALNRKYEQRKVRDKVQHDEREARELEGMTALEDD